MDSSESWELIHIALEKLPKDKLIEALGIMMRVSNLPQDYDFEGKVIVTKEAEELLRKLGDILDKTIV